MTEATAWRHKNSEADNDFARRLLLRVREVFPQRYPLSTWQLADVLTEIGMELKGHTETDPLWYAQRYIDLGAYLNDFEVAGDLEPVERPEVPRWARLWCWLRRKQVYVVPPPIDVVFTAPPGPGSECVFVEVEQGGRSVGAASWVDRPDGTVALRLPAGGG